MTSLNTLPAPFSKLPTLKRLKRLYETPIGERFHQPLVTKWMPLMRSLSRGFAIPRRLEEEDIVQELSLVLWGLTERVDPVTQPDEFRRYIKREMRQRCIDLTRYYKAQKRTSRSGKGLQCQVCSAVTAWTSGDQVECGVCQASEKKVRWIDLYATDVSIRPEPWGDEWDDDDSSYSISVGTYQDSRQADPSDLTLNREVAAKAREALTPFPDRQLFDLYVDPPYDFVDMMLQNGYPANPRKAPYWLLASYLGGISEKVLRMAHTRIGLVVATLSDRTEMIGYLSPYNLRQVGYSASAT